MKLKAIALDTLNITDRGHYETLDGRVDIRPALDAAELGTQLYRPEDFERLNQTYADDLAGRPTYETTYEVTGETTMAAMERLTKTESDLFCLNFASAKNPGGGFMGGAQAQEESLARSSGLYYCISQRSEMYAENRKQSSCIYLDYMIYSPGVPFFKDDHGDLLSQPYHVSMLTAPAVNAGAVKQHGNPHDIARIEEVMHARVEKVLAIAALRGHEVLVLGAWGCGVFRNSPENVAGHFAHHLLENNKFKNRFRKVVFAVLDRTEAKQTLGAFQKRF